MDQLAGVKKMPRHSRRYEVTVEVMVEAMVEGMVQVLVEVTAMPSRSRNHQQRQTKKVTAMMWVT